MTQPVPVDESLKQFATDRQKEVLDAVIELGSARQAADKLEVQFSYVSRVIKAVKKKAALSGHAPEFDMTHAAPDPFIVKGTSTLYDAAGNVTQQWVKTTVDQDRVVAMIREIIESMADEIPREPIAPLPANVSEHLCNLYVMTDCHVGMLAWHKEGGADWDLKIAEQVLTGCFDQMVDSSPDADTCVVGQLGDWLHSDGMLPVTPTSHHVLDQDGRFSKIVQASIRILRRLIRKALEKHRIVIVIMAEGNHDPASSIWLRALFKALYEDEPRVQVIDSELPYYVYQHGNTMLAFHHGHLKKTDSLPILFAAQFPKVWGDTTKRYAHTGHKHCVEEKEHSGMTVIQHPTLAARDAYAARGGWLAERQVTSITYHQKYGQVGRVTITPEMLDA